MSIPAICIVGWADSGKTTLIEGLLRQLTAQGMRVGVIKHTHHPLPEDEAGKDTARFQAAGAATVTLANSEGALTREAGLTASETRARLHNAAGAAFLPPEKREALKKKIDERL